MSSPARASEASSPQREADHDQTRPLPEHEAQHVLALRAEGQADAEFAGALADAVRHRPVNSQHRQQQGHRGKPAEQDDVQARRGNAAGHRARQGRNLADGLIGVHLPDRGLDAFGQALGAESARRAGVKSGVGLRALETG